MEFLLGVVVGIALTIFGKSDRDSKKLDDLTKGIISEDDYIYYRKLRQTRKQKGFAMRLILLLLLLTPTLTTAKPVQGTKCDLIGVFTIGLAYLPHAMCDSKNPHHPRGNL